MAADQAPTANEYILHHLTFLSNREPKGVVDFTTIHLDSIFFSVLLAVLFGGAFYLAARNGDAPYMRLLADHGADTKMPNVLGITPLIVAAGLDYWEGE